MTNQGTLTTFPLALSNLPFSSGPSRQRSLKKATCCSFPDAINSHCPTSPGESGDHLCPWGCISRDGSAAGRARWGRPQRSSSPRQEAPVVSAQSVRPIAPSLSFQVRLRCSVTVTEPRSWQPPPPRRQQHLSAPRTRLACGTCLAECAPGLSCIETFSSPCTRKGRSRGSSSPTAESGRPGSINEAQERSTSPSPILPSFPPPFHLPKAVRRPAEQQQQVQKVRGRRTERTRSCQLTAPRRSLGPELHGAGLQGAGVAGRPWRCGAEAGAGAGNRRSAEAGGARQRGCAGGRLAASPPVGGPACPQAPCAAQLVQSIKKEKINK